MNSEIKDWIKLKYPQLFVPIFLCFKIPLTFKLLRFPSRFRYSDLARYKHKKPEVVVLGSGQTVNELTEDDYKSISQRVSIALGRWIYQDFVPDIYILEASESEHMMRWVKDFCAELTRRANEYQNTIIIFDGTKGSKKIHSFIKESVPKSIHENIRYSITLKSPSGSSEVFHVFLKFMLKTKLYRLFDLLLHCRSSSVLAVLLGLYFEPRKIILSGVDGYVGYFAADDNKKFHGDYGGLDKNYNYELHSTANPVFGLPTVTDCMRIISSEAVPCEVTSERTLLSKHLPIHSFNST